MQTRHQVPRAAMADAENLNRLYLMKSVSVLRATYQIRLLTFRAVSEGLILVLRVPKACQFHPDLLQLKKTSGVIAREDF
ncbi:hypothetical protein [Rhizobium sp.]